MRRIAVAIDGPSGAGKSTIAKAVAKELGFLYVDTGAIYRTVGLFVKRKGVLPEDAEAVAALLSEIKIDVRYENDVQCMYLNGDNVTQPIREHEISAYASKVSAIPAVRIFLLETQRGYAGKYSVIMDGRDIGTVVLPNADIKLFLTASLEDRAMRRYLELRSKGSDIDYETVLNDVRIRDENDSQRTVAPLKPADDAMIVDTTGNTLKQSITLIKNLISERIS